MYSYGEEESDTINAYYSKSDMTAKSLNAIGSVGGPRCCKRDSYLSILSAVDFVKEHFGIEMEKTEIICEFSSKNNQCLGKNCPFSKVYH